MRAQGATIQEKDEGDTAYEHSQTHAPDRSCRWSEVRRAGQLTDLKDNVHFSYIVDLSG